MVDFRRNISLEIFIEVYRAYPVSFLGREDVELTNSSNLVNNVNKMFSYFTTVSIRKIIKFK
jgi:hypothetical protein